MKRFVLGLSAGAAAVTAVAVSAQHAGQRPQSRPAAFPAAQPATLDAQLAALRAGIARYADFDMARREGWKKFGGDGPLVGEHWYLPERSGGPDYVHGQPLDFARPSNLMYTDIAGRKVLTGVTFNVRIGKDEPVPAGFSGNDDIWHVHDFRVFFATALRDRPAAHWLVERTMDRRWSGRDRLAMIHVWVGSIPNPDGTFAHYNRLVPYLKLGLTPAMADGASMAAARGLHLATAGGCASAIDGQMRMAGGGAGARERLHQACAAAAAHVRDGIAAGDKASVNAMAEHGWAMFDAAWNRELTAEQKARIAAVTEHDHPVPPQGEAHKHDH